jgi:hypothetical protein
VPDEFAGGVNRRPGFFHDFDEPAQSVVGEFAPSREPRVVDRDESIGAVPLESPRTAVTGNTTVRIVGESAVLPIDSASCSWIDSG